MKTMKKILAFTMVLTMLLGCFMFSTSAADAEGAPANAPGAGTGDIKYYGTCTQSGQENQQFFVVRDDGAGNVTMYVYSDGTNSGWFRPLSNATHWGTTNLGDDGVAWCKANVTKLVLDGVASLAAEAFKDYTALKYVEYDVTDIDVETFIQRGALFSGCTLKAIYPTGTTPVDGVADFRTITKLGRGYDEGQGGPLSGITGIETVLLGEQVNFTCTSSFAGMTGLKTVRLAAMDADKITQTGLHSGWYLNLPVGAVIDCANQAVAEKVASDVTYDANVVTYSLYSGINTAGVATYRVVEEGDEIVMYLDETAGNAGAIVAGFCENRWSAADEGDNLTWFKANVTKAVVSANLGGIGYNMFDGFAALKTIEIASDNIVIKSNGTFAGCTALTSIYKTGSTPEAGVADLSMVTQFGQQGWGLNFFWGVTGIKTVKFGNEVKFGCPNPFEGMVGLEKVTISATDATKITAEGLTSSWYLRVPEGAIIECANTDVADKLAEAAFVNTASISVPSLDDGNDDGGNTDGGNTDGGNTDGGNTDDGNTTDTKTPETTKAPDTESTTTEAPEEKNGCGLTVTLSAVMIVATVGTCVVTVKKRED